VIVSLGIGLRLWTAQSLPGARSELTTILGYGTPNLLACTLLITSGFLDAVPHKLLWVIFALAILTAIQMAKSGDWIVRASHFAGRHNLTTVIAFDEIVVSIGLSVVDSLDEELEGRSRARFAGKVCPMTHIPLIAGIISMAAATEEILRHPKGAVHTKF
jgi:low temperature requirement protein LtrA